MYKYRYKIGLSTVFPKIIMQGLRESHSHAHLYSHNSTRMHTSDRQSLQTDTWKDHMPIDALHNSPHSQTATLCRTRKADAGCQSSQRQLFRQPVWPLMSDQWCGLIIVTVNSGLPCSAGPPSRLCLWLCSIVHLPQCCVPCSEQAKL